MTSWYSVKSGHPWFPGYQIYGCPEIIAVHYFKLSRWHVANGFQQMAMFKTVYPFWSLYILMFKDQAHCPFPNLRGIIILSRNGVSGKPGAVQNETGFIVMSSQAIAGAVARVLTGSSLMSQIDSTLHRPDTHWRRSSRFNDSWRMIRL